MFQSFVFGLAMIAGMHTGQVPTQFVATHIQPARVAIITTTAYKTDSCTAIVQAGDTLGGIAQQNGTTWQNLQGMNGIGNPNLIYPGQRIALCGGSTSSVTPSATQSYSGGGNTSGYSWGECTWGAAYLSHNNVTGLGNAVDWAYNAAARGMSVGSTPQVGATVVFTGYYHSYASSTGGVQTVSWGTSGHVAHVVGVTNGAIEIEEMNNSYYGGFGKWDTVWIQFHYGNIQFIY